ncbi:MAG: right-handed parallel beta-helix repeat-containing protein [Planctomycetota bacterium]
MRNFVGLSVLLWICAIACGATVNVEDYGAIADSEAAGSGNATAFNAAVAAAGDGGTVYIPPKLYYMSGSVYFGNDTKRYENVTLDGYGATMKRASSADPYQLISPGTGWVIQGLSIDQDRFSDVPNWRWGIKIAYGNAYGICNITIKDCTIKNVPYDGIYVSDGVYGVTVENCNIIDNHRQGLSYVDANGGVIKNCYFRGNKYQGLDIEPDGCNTYGFEVLGCTFDGANDLNHLNIWGAAYGSADINVVDCNFINGADLVGNRLVGEVSASNNTFGSGSGVIFNSFNDNTEGTGRITLSENSFADVTNDGINLITNGGFESWTGVVPDSWSVVGGGTVEQAQSGDVLAGDGALHIANVSGTTEVQQSVSATAGAYYTYGYHIKRASGSLWMKVQFLNSSSSVVGTQKLLPLLTGEYEKVMGIAKAPAGTASIRISVGRNTSFNAVVDSLFVFKGIGTDSDGAPVDCGMVRNMGLLFAGDLNEDCYINLEDLALFANNWLKCNDPEDENCQAN